MKKNLLLSIAVLAFISGSVLADIFGTGANQFTIDFVDISGATNPSIGYGIVNHDYRIGTYEISNDQWNKFKANYGTVTGSPSMAYDESAYFSGTNVPTNELSWYEAAQFVNYLNTSTGHQAAYKFTGTQGTSNYTMTVWDVLDNGYDASNPLRNSKAKYFIPSEDEWVKAAYWNGTNLQTWATVGDVAPTQNGWNYYDYEGGYANDPAGPWDVDRGTEEINGTKNMMGNVWEMLESPYYENDSFDSYHVSRGGVYFHSVQYLRSSHRKDYTPWMESNVVGLRVASIPEPATLLLLGMGGLLISKRK